MDCAESTFHVQLAGLKKAGKVISVKVGRESRYALPGWEAELYASTKKQTALERHIINNALRLIDEILNVERENETVVYHCYLLYAGLQVLRKKRPEIYTFGTGPEADERAVLAQWYRYWIEILRILGVF
jgi:hypothetical protein